MTISGTTRGKMQINMEKRKFKKTYFQKAQSKKNRKVHLTNEVGPSVTVAEVQSQQQTDHAKAVARGAHPGCGRNQVRAQPPWRFPGPTLFWRLHAAMHRTVSPTTIFRSARTVLWSYKLVPPLHISKHQDTRRRIEGVVLLFQ